MPYYRYVVQVFIGFFFVVGPRPDGWFHVVVNFLGPNDGQGFTVYNDGVQIGTGSRRIGSTEHVEADGRIVLGRFYTEDNSFYGSVFIDELYFYNQCLSQEEITRLSQELLQLI